MQTIQWGIIGCGDVTEVKSGPAFNKVPDSRLIAVMRRNAAKAKNYAERHGVSKWYSNADELIHDPEVTAVYVATPPLQHEEYTVKALQAGKPVYVEKPMAVDAPAARRMMQVARQTGVKLSVAHYRRQQPQFLRIKELLSANVIGNIRFVNLQLLQPNNSSMIAQTEVPWRVYPAISGGGLFHDLAPHQLDLMRYFFGKAKAASGIALNGARFYKADDTVAGNLLFENDVLFTGLWCFTVPPEEKKDVCEIIGSEGKITFSVFDYGKIMISRNGTEEVLQFGKLEHVQQPMIEQVVQYFLGAVPNPCPAEEGVEVMQMIDDFTNKSLL